MKPITKLIALATATLIAFAPITASAANLSDGVFSWPTDYKSAKISEASSTFDGNTQKLKIKTPTKTKTQKAKRK